MAPSKFDDTLNHVEKRDKTPKANQSPPKPVKMPSNQKESTVSDRYTEVANNYFMEVVDRVMEDYTNLVPSTNREEETLQNDHINDLSIERRMDDQSVDQSDNDSHNNQEEVSIVQTENSSSTIHNMAIDYVSNMIGGLS